MQLVTHIFDSHVVNAAFVKWTLEQLADFIRTIEPAEPEPEIEEPENETILERTAC